MSRVAARGGCDTFIRKENALMTRRIYPSNVVEKAQDVLVGWQQVNEELTFGPLTPAALQEDINAASPMQAEISNLEKQLADARDQRDILFNAIWDKVKRVRAGVKATYGDDSQQYETVGGTRMSDRKSRARKGSTAVTIQ
jgi:hypothetical protein